MSIRRVQDKLKGRRRDGENPSIVLPFPVSPSLRLTQLSPGPRFANAKPTILKRWSDLQVFAPNIIVGSLREFQRLTEYVSSGAFDPSAVDRALVVLTRIDVKPLNDIARVSLWQTFGVPIFELYLSLDQSLLASECEAHEGWHLAPGIGSLPLESGELILYGAGNAGLRTGLRASVNRDTCPCGQTSARVLDVEPLRHADERFIAVSA